MQCHFHSYNSEGPEGVKWELGSAIFRGWEMGFCELGLGFVKQKQQINGNGLSIWATQAGIGGSELGLEKNNLLGNGIRNPPSGSSVCVRDRDHSHRIARSKYYGVMAKWINFNCHWAKWQRLGAKIRSLTYFLRSSNLNLNSSFGDRELLAPVCLVSSRRRTGKMTKKILSTL